LDRISPIIGKGAALSLSRKDDVERSPDWLVQTRSAQTKHRSRVIAGLEFSGAVFKDCAARKFFSQAISCTDFFPPFAIAKAD
jgi:hypothetical protein